MELITGIILASLVVIWSVFYFSPKNRKLRRIPGPTGYPLIGNALQIDQKRPYETARHWAKQYGDVMRINLFGQPVVIASSQEAISEFMVKKSNDFAGRPESYRRDVLFKRNHSLVLSDLTPRWSYMKKASMTGLKQVGDQVTALDDIMQGYLDDFTQNLAKMDGKIVDVRKNVTNFVYLVTYTLIHGREIDPLEFAEFCDVNSKFVEIFSPNAKYQSLDELPFLRGFWNKHHRSFKKFVYGISSVYSRHAAKTVKDYTDEEIKCVLDSLIREMKNPSDKMPSLDYDDILGTAIDLVFAGVTTTSSAIYFFLALMATNPEIQEEAHTCVMEVIGDRPPSLNDRQTIPYIESMMLEILRYFSHVPLSVPHVALVDTSLRGYDIPKGTQVWGNTWALHHDERLWEDPWEFKPKRFLDKDGNLVKADHPLRKQFLAFGAGRRVCAGESLAKHRIFLFMVTMLQKFKMSEPKNEKIVTDPREFGEGLLLYPLDYNVCVELRK